MTDPMDYSRLADVYDSFVRTSFDISFFLNEAKKTQGEVLELMSGTGRVSMPLIEAGVRLTCVDNSPEMLARLREKLEKKRLSAGVRQMDVRDLSLKRMFDLIIIPFHSFAELVSADDQRRALAGIHCHLSPTGRFICTFHNPAMRLKPVDGRLRLLGKYPLQDREGFFLLWLLENYDSKTQTASGLELFEEYDAKGVMRSKRLFETRFRLLEKQQFEDLAQSSGFRVESLYGDYSYKEYEKDSSPFMIWVLRK